MKSQSFSENESEFELSSPYKNNYLHRYAFRKQLLKEQNIYSKELLITKKQTKKQANISNYELKNSELTVFFNNEPINTESHPSDFSSLSIHPQLLYNLNTLNISTMTPIQRLSIPIILNQFGDTVGCAQTGSGKTIAYLLPIISRLLDEDESSIVQIKSQTQASYPLVLVILPTRELCQQTYKESLTLLYNTNIIAGMVYGGERVGEQKHMLRKGIDVMLGTPGRLLQFLYEGYLNFSMLKYLVIDEADVLLDMGFYPDIMDIINNETMSQSDCRINLLFSATFPFKVMDLIEHFVNEHYYFITNHLPSKKEEEIPNGNIVQRVYLMNKDNIMKTKIDVLHKVLQIIQGKTLVFLNTKNGVKYLSNYLNNNGYGIACLHGDMEQTERNHNLYLFTSGEMNLMICTDVLSRGMDISDVEFVINFDMPKDIATYVHRIGRTGRCGNKGNSITFVSYEDRGLFPQLLDIMRKSDQNVPEWLEEECGDEGGYKKFK